MKTEETIKLKYSECVDIGKLIGCSGEYVRQVATGRRNSKSSKAQLIMGIVHIIFNSKRNTKAEIEKLIASWNNK